jgi:hypothetical protein
MLVTNQMITQVYLVPELSTKLDQYDRIRWYRSTTGRTGFYEQATAEDPAPALLQLSLVSRALHAKTLKLRVGGSVVIEHTFVSPDPYALADVAAELEGASSSIHCIVSGDALLLTTTLTGSAASLEVLSSDAAPLLGLLAGETAVGLSADNELVEGISEYQFTDYQGAPTHWYTVEYRNAATDRTSARSITFPSRRVDSVPVNKLIGCFVRLCDLGGRPVAGRRVTIHNVFQPNRVETPDKSWGVFRQYEELVTDPNGYAEAFLVRGARVDVTIAGTGFTRRITIPTTGTIVDLLSASLDTEDEFGIAQTNVDFAIRTTT